MAEQKKQESHNGEFKTVPLGFDKAEVMAYIVQHNKTKKAFQEENEQLKAKLDEFLKAKYADGTIARLAEKYKSVVVNEGALK